MKKVILSLALAAISFAVSAETLKDNVSLRINSETGIYAKGDTICVWADVRNVPADKEIMLQIREYNKDGVAAPERVYLKEGENLLFKGAFDTATHQVFKLMVKGANKADNDNYMNVGAIVAPEEFTPGFEAPKDLQKFWNREIRKMRAEKMKPILVKEKSPSEGIEVYSVEINCVGPRPVRGYLAFPEGAEPKSLPAILLLHAASSTGGTSKIGAVIPYAKMGALVIDFNAHGMKNMQSEEYYAELFKGDLKGYSGREPESKDTYYFKWMFLRALRALDYMCNHELWDGKHMVVTGGSQGGAQSCFLAAIDPRVTAAAITCPAMLDQGGKLAGRTSAWPKTMDKYPESSKVNSPYFDPALMLKNTKAEIWCEIGLYDLTCPPANVFAAMNQVKTKKTVVTFQRNHTFRTTPELQVKHKPLEEQKMDFIKYAFTN